MARTTVWLLLFLLLEGEAARQDVDGLAQQHMGFEGISHLDGANVSTKVEAPEKPSGIRKEIYVVEGLFLIVMVAMMIYPYYYHSGKNNRSQHKASSVAMKCEFLEFRRPALSEDTGTPCSGFFHPGQCPPEPVGTMQAWYQPNHTIYSSTIRHICPWSSVRSAVAMAMLTGILWCILGVCNREEIFDALYRGYHHNTRSPDELETFWQSLVGFVSRTATAQKFAVSFFMIYVVKQKVKQLEKLKDLVWRSQRDIEQTAFMVAGFLTGEDFHRKSTRYNIHRWLTAAHFFNHAAASQSLGEYDASHLGQANLLTQAEAQLVTKAVAQSRHARPGASGGGLVFDRMATWLQELESNDGKHFQTRLFMPPWADQDGPDMQSNRDRAFAARDLCLWWVQVRLQAAVKEKLMDKDKLKKILGAVWKSRESMDAILTAGDRRIMLIVAFCLKLVIYIWIAMLPFQAIDQADIYHLWLVAGPMMYTFFSAFFYHSLLLIVESLWYPFGFDVDDLNLDPILVSTERVTFTNMSRNCVEDLPPDLASLWEKVKDIPDEKDKDEKKDKDKQKDAKDTAEDKQKDTEANKGQADAGPGSLKDKQKDTEENKVQADAAAQEKTKGEEQQEKKESGEAGAMSQTSAKA